MASDQQIIYLNPRELLPSHRNVRSDPGNLAGLAETIREHGILQPLGVAQEGPSYRVVYGNRRRDAAIVVGLDRVPCVTVQADDPEEVLVQQVLENLQRLDLSDMDKAQAFETLLRGLTDGGASSGEALDAMARTLGLSGRQIQRYLRLLQLAPQVRQWIANGELGVTVAQHLVDIAPAHRQESIAELAIEESLSAAELARLCSSLASNPNIAPAAALSLLRRGETVPRLASEPEEPTRLSGPGPDMSERGGAEDGPPWDDEEEPRRALQADDYAHMEPVSRDGNRVLRIHSLDVFMDELQRLTECLQSGDLQRLMESDDAAGVKISLASRQLRYLAEAVSILAQEA